jgi:hypothetical protein
MAKSSEVYMIRYVVVGILIVFGVIALLAVGIYKATKDDHRNDRTPLP